MIEFRNETPNDVVCRIVKVKATGNYFIYISSEEELADIDYEQIGEEGWVKVNSHSYNLAEKIFESQW